MSPHQRHRGFTLIELVMVIVILGVLASVALPKLLDLRKDAKIAALEGAHGAISTGMNLVYARAMLDGTHTLASSSVNMGGATIATVYGYPSYGNAVLSAAGLSSPPFYASMTVNGVGLVTYTTVQNGSYTSNSACALSYQNATATAPAQLGVPSTWMC